MIAGHTSGRRPNTAIHSVAALTASTACPALYSFRKQSRSGQGSRSATRSVVLCLLQTVFHPVALFKGASMQCLMGYRLSWPQLYTLTYL